MIRKFINNLKFNYSLLEFEEDLLAKEFTLFYKIRYLFK